MGSTPTSSTREGSLTPYQIYFGAGNPLLGTKTMQHKFPRGNEIVGAAVIKNSKGEILLVQSEKWRNKWTMPGGHIEPGETIERALLREAEEEVGLKLSPVAITSFGELINSKDFYRPAHFIYFDLWCRVAGKPKVELDRGEVSAYVWVRPKKALQMDLAEKFDKVILDYLKFRNLH